MPNIKAFPRAKNLYRLKGGAEMAESFAEYVLIPQISIILGCCITSRQIPESVIRHKYLENRLSMRDIARELACSKTHIRDQLLKHNIPLRQPNRRYNKWYAYGKRRVSGRTIAHKGEKRTIATIKQMYGEGIGIRAIARFLNTMKIPTKQQGKGWHHFTVTQILKREGVYVVGRKGVGSAASG